MESGETFLGGNTDREKLFISPTILDKVSYNDKIMEEEIFGPLLPVIEYSNLEELIKNTKSLPKPLALYLFTKDKKIERKILQDISSGGAVVNDTILHMANYNLPFGGVGDSGMGAYHGKFGFDTFSHLKGVLKKRIYLDFLFRYPPYNFPIKWLRKILG